MNYSDAEKQSQRTRTVFSSIKKMPSSITVMLGHTDAAKINVVLTGIPPTSTVFSRYCSCRCHLFLQNSVNGRNLISKKAVEHYFMNSFQEKLSSFYKNVIKKFVSWKIIVGYTKTVFVQISFSIIITNLCDHSISSLANDPKLYSTL